ncbi:hypothetical protein VNI00_016042 [Paramarasmius palmivorus]|uniref:Sulfhydryl oxidase n=1 Tax=Paramarasmius palmivorus TaxID=297713 RepID=A0AAW0BHE6_9AGAR
MSIGLALASGVVEIKDDKGNPKPEAEHLFWILTSEYAHLIWKIRCEYVIEERETPPMHQEVYNHLKAIVNCHLCQDQLLANRKSHKQRPAAVLTIKKTWEKVIQCLNGTMDWLKMPGVLVGVEPLEQILRQ